MTATKSRQSGHNGANETAYLLQIWWLAPFFCSLFCSPFCSLRSKSWCISAALVLGIVGLVGGMGRRALEAAVYSLLGLSFNGSMWCCGLRLSWWHK